MEQMAISKFKSTCLAVLERVRRTRKPIQITRFGEPMAEVIPPSPGPRPADWIGCLSSTGSIAGDIVSPTSEQDEWEVMRS